MDIPAKQMVKDFIGRALIRTGVWDRLLRMWALRREAIILTYHRVIEKWDRTLDYSQPGMVVTADTFDRQLSFLKKYFHIVPLSSLVARQSTLDSQPSTLRPLCALTFDDGWRDNYDIAFPILRKHEVPATIFLSTDFIETNRLFWHTELIYLLMHGELGRIKLSKPAWQSYPERVRHHLNRLARSTETPSPPDLDPLIEAVKATCGDDTLHDLIRELRHAFGIRGSLFPDRRFFLDWNQVCEMRAAGIEIGSHGCSHRILTRIKLQDAEDELVRSKAEIERHTGEEVKHFAFPDGAANRDLMAFVEKARYRTACLWRTVPIDGRFGTLALQRVGMHEGVSGGGNRSFMESDLALWLFRAPRMRRK